MVGPLVTMIGPAMMVGPQLMKMAMAQAMVREKRRGERDRVIKERFWNIDGDEDSAADYQIENPL